MVHTAEVRDPKAPDSARSTQPVTSRTGPRIGLAGRSVLGSTTTVLMRLVWAAVAVVDIALALDFVFRLIGAKNDGFAHAMLSFGSTVAGPFDGIFARVGTIAGYALRWSDGVAIIVVTLAGFIVTRLLRLARPRQRWA